MVVLDLGCWLWLLELWLGAWHPAVLRLLFGLVTKLIVLVALSSELFLLLRWLHIQLIDL